VIYYIGHVEEKNREVDRSSIKEALNYFKDKKYIQLDTETEGFDPHTKKLLCWQIGDYNTQFVINNEDYPIEGYKEFFEDVSKVFILQNAKFDLGFTLHAGVEVSNVYDTLLAEIIINTGRKHIEMALDELCWKYLNVFLDKSIRGDIHRFGMSDTVIEYAGKDVKYLEKIMDLQQIQIKELELTNVLNLENEVVKVFAHMEYNGVRINTSIWNNIIKSVNKDLKKSGEDLDAFVIANNKLKKFILNGIQKGLFNEDSRVVNVNWSSPAQKLDVLNTIGMEMSSVNKRSLSKNSYKTPVIKELINHSKLSKLSSSFGKKFLTFVNKETGRVHPNYWQIVDTGRISVKEPNVNQIPSKGDTAKIIRSAFIPKDGYKIVGGDYSGMELRIIAEFSQDPIWVNAFKNGEDLHSKLCALTFGIDEKDVMEPFPSNPDLCYRDVQKTVNFGLAYGMSKYKLSDTMNISLEDADKIITKFFKAVPKVERLLNTLGELGSKRGFIRTTAPFRRIRWFEDYEDSKFTEGIIRQSKNSPIQGTNADIIKQALIDTYAGRIDKRIGIILSVYDEIQTECPNELVEVWEKTLEKIMIDAAQKVIKTIPVEVDCKTSDYWAK
jgi:DNA polymerase-1